MAWSHGKAWHSMRTHARLCIHAVRCGAGATAVRVRVQSNPVERCTHVKIFWQCGTEPLPLSPARSLFPAALFYSTGVAARSGGARASAFSARRAASCASSRAISARSAARCSSAAAALSRTSPRGGTGTGGLGCLVNTQNGPGVHTRASTWTRLGIETQSTQNIRGLRDTECKARELVASIFCKCTSDSVVLAKGWKGNTICPPFVWCRVP